MPVILHREDEETWLNPDVTKPEHLLPLLKPYPATQMETWRVGDGAKNSRNDSAELIKPLKEAMDIDSITIERLPPEKWQEYKALRLRALHDDPHAFSEPLDKALAYSDAIWQQKTAEAYEGKESLIVFARAGEQVVGMIGAFFPKNEKNVAYIFGVYVVPEARGKGISKQLLEVLLHELKANPAIATVKLEVNKEQVAAVKLYERFGFQVVGEENSLLGDGNYYDTYLMCRSPLSLME